MFGLELRQEFLGRRLQGTAIELANENQTGATQRPTAGFLEITYPTGDVLAALEAIGPDYGQPLCLMGERGQGKSHLLGLLHHALTDPDATKQWLDRWSQRLANPKLAELPFRRGMTVITSSLHRQSHRLLWDLLFEKHPQGDYIRGKWEGQGDKKTDVPGHALLVEMFRGSPTALMLDEFQTWYVGLRNTKDAPQQAWAFNFIQVLSEIAKEHPDLLVLVVSVRDGSNEAYQQVHRVGPRLINFKGPQARRDRQRLLLHRLFENRIQVAEDHIRTAIATHVREHLRIKDVPITEHDRVSREFVEAWPFSPALLTILEDQVLVATQAQETRDLIRILADLFRSHGDDEPILTAADFRLDDDKSGITALLDSVSNQHHANLREKAQRNLSAVRDAVKRPEEEVPHLDGIVAALWLRSLALASHSGAEPADLHVDITKGHAIDDNLFDAELERIRSNSFNIHPEGARLVFREEESPETRLRAGAANDKLFETGSDLKLLAKEVRHVLVGEPGAPTAFRVVVLPATWRPDPWPALDESDRPDHWDDERITILVVPESLDQPAIALGPWLKQHLQESRNAVRFLLQRAALPQMFADRELVLLARGVVLAEQWRGDSSEYGRLRTKYERDLRDRLKPRFDRLAILDTWNFPEPTKCTFHIERHQAEGAKIAAAVDDRIRQDLFVPEIFEELVRSAAARGDSVGKLLDELMEPRPNGAACIPWIGIEAVKERLARLCARGDVAINLRGLDHLQRQHGEDEDAAFRRMKGRLGNRGHLRETFLLLPQPAPQAQGAAQVGLFPPSTPPTGGPPSIATPGTAPLPPPPPQSSIFEPPDRVTPYTSGATSALNLYSKARDAWGIATGTQVRDVKLRADRLTGAQLEKLLKGLPDGVTYELSLEKEDR